MSKADLFVYVNQDGTVRDLMADEREYLNEEFHGADGGRPYIKLKYEDRTPDSKIGGFLYRSMVPHGTPISSP
jgi:hypothetical protein